MKRILLLGALVAGILVPAAAAAPAATHSLRGTVVAKDRAHHALVVAMPGGTVQTLVAPGRSFNTRLGRKVVVRYSTKAGALSQVVKVVVKGKANHARVRGTIVRIVKRQAIINAGGTALKVNLRNAKRQRTLAAAASGPEVGDVIEVEVEIDEDDGSLDATKVVAGGAPAAAGAELQVRGKVTTLTPATATDPGEIVLDVRGLVVRCVIPVGIALDVKVGDLVEITCDAAGDPAQWTVRAGHGEDAKGEDDGADDVTGSDDDGDEHGTGSGEHAGKVEVRGTIAASFTQLDSVVTVTPDGGGTDVVCAITPGSLAGFSAGDAVKMECETVDGTLTLHEIEKVHGDESGDDEGESGDGDHGGSGGGGDGGDSGSDG